MSMSSDGQRCGSSNNFGSRMLSISRVMSVDEILVRDAIYEHSRALCGSIQKDTHTLVIVVLTPL